MKIADIFTSLAVLLLASCATPMQTDEREQAIDKAAGEAINSPSQWLNEVENNVETLSQWPQSFNDPILLKLIEEGKANNKDLQVAAGNMEKAWLLAKQSGAALKPTVDLSMGRTQSGSVEGGTSNSNVAVGLQASWEADVWGRISAGIDAADARAVSAQADYIYAQQSLSANIAKTYFKAIEAKLQADIARKNLKILQKTMRITQVKYDNGLSTGQDIALNKANLAAAKEQLITIEGSQRDALRGLEVLLGRYPNTTLEIPDILPDLPPSPPAGVPSSILERRPDIVSAERKIASAFNATDQAKAAQLPRFSLTTTVSGASSSLSDILDPANAAWQLGANLIAPLYDGDRRKIDVEIATVEQEQAVSNYAQQALTAFSEVENNLDQGRVLADRQKALSEVQRHSSKAFRIAELRYKEGETELLDTLQIQQQAISAKSNLISIERSQLEQRVNLYLALGGSW